ncbi:MAG: acyltransferase [Muribaculum sp.]|nr:acyltransferase [Muribaculum sp.]
MLSQREPYIDFLRSLGLILLIGVHVNAPEWYVPLRSFDVPLMVFVSALCYKSLGGGYLQYFVKRFKRIYIPVFVFLTLFSFSLSVCYLVDGKSHFSISQIVGSYLLLNSPSIGYVWIMRVFLMMALLLPLLDWLNSRLNPPQFLLFIIGIIAIQTFVVDAVMMIKNKYIYFALDEIILYAIGYTPIAITGLRLRKLGTSESIWIVVTTGVLITVFLSLNGCVFCPQTYKYPPQSLYVLYGVFASSLLWSIRNHIKHYIDNKVCFYLSKNSMWIYLWHIIPVYIVARWGNIHGFWFGRYCIVIAVALILNKAYHMTIMMFPNKIFRWLK